MCGCVWKCVISCCEFFGDLVAGGWLDGWVVG